jgi:hypothetical protein
VVALRSSTILFNDNDLPARRSFVNTEPPRATTRLIAPGVEIVPRGYYVDSANNTRTPSYTLFNVKMGFEYKPNSCLRGADLTDKSLSRRWRWTTPTELFLSGDGRGFYGWSRGGKMRPRCPS